MKPTPEQVAAALHKWQHAIEQADERPIKTLADLRWLLEPAE